MVKIALAPATSREFDPSHSNANGWISNLASF